MTFKGKSLEESLPQAAVDIEDKSRSNLFTWRGQFSPQLIEQILVNYSSEGEVVFDPFLGSGTVLFESALLGLEAYGCEINPAAVAFAAVYELINEPKDRVLSAINDIEQIISKYTNDLPLFENEDIANFQDELIAALKTSEDSVKSTILLSLITGMDFGAKKLDTKRINNVWGTLRSNIENLPASDKPLKCFQRDSRDIPLENGTVDFVVTSPPYINVFNYHQNYRKAIESTGVDVLKVARSEIGANRKFRQNRFLTVVQYCMDMSQVFMELRRVCKKTAKVIFIVGRESNVRKTAFKNAELISGVAEVCGFRMEGEQHRVFQNKFGEDIYEEILRFSLTDGFSRDYINDAREIGRTALKEATITANEEVKDEIREAHERSRTIDPSPNLAETTS
ncbi:DNA methyltransferase [Endozoicomonas sp. 4G]|uniref:DNA methyltransferase n=1 Tax=Endozoicomonas sp. 4G TaxID=2872754 RepID=UPI002078B2E5|nr:DNA methyltransferase [Endozoicomonas sp. 4G]